jgi:hypothetical protein
LCRQFFELLRSPREIGVAMRGHAKDRWQVGAQLDPQFGGQELR